MPDNSPLFSIMPMIIMAIPIAIFNLKIAKRKGKSPLLFFVIGVIPMVNIFAFLYLISLTDKEVIDTIQMIRSMLEKKDN